MLGAFLKDLVVEEVDEVTSDKDGETVVLEMAAKLPAESARALKNYVVVGKDTNGVAQNLIDALSKAGSRHSKADMASLQEMGAYVATTKKHLDKMGKAHDKAVEAHGEVEKCADGMGKCMKALGIDPDTAGGEEVEDENSPGKETGKDKDKDAEKMHKALIQSNATVEALQGVITKLTTDLDVIGKRLAVVEKEPVSNPKGVKLIVEKRNEEPNSGSASVDADTPYVTPTRISPIEMKRRR